MDTSRNDCFCNKTKQDGKERKERKKGGTGENKRKNARIWRKKKKTKIKK